MEYKKLDPVEKADWIRALRSGEFFQTVKVLCKETVSVGNSPQKIMAYCCLGVKLKLSGWKLGTNGTSMISPPEKGNSYWLEAINLDSNTIDTLIAMNDNGSSFNEIADWIEENL